MKVQKMALLVYYLQEQDYEYYLIKVKEVLKHMELRTILQVFQ